MLAEGIPLFGSIGLRLSDGQAWCPNLLFCNAIIVIAYIVTAFVVQDIETTSINNHTML